MTLTIPSAFQSQVEDHKLHFHARLFKITLSTLDYRIFRFTDHSEDLTFSDGAVYQSVDGVDATATRRADGINPTNKDVRGVITSDDITYSDLNAGLFNGARVDEYLVDTRQPFNGAIEAMQYFITRMKFDGAAWIADVDSFTNKLTKPTGDIWGPQCRVELFSQGNGKCNLDSAPFVENVAISALIDAFFSFEFVLTNAFWSNPGIGNEGRVFFNSGALGGFEARIKFHTSPGDERISLHKRLPYPMAVSDSITLFPGCNKRLSGEGNCVPLYDNGINFQGEPFIPGSDLTRKGPRVK